MNKDIRKAIMTRTRLRNRFRKEATPMNRRTYEKQRNNCVLLMRESMMVPSMLIALRIIKTSGG